MTFLYILLSVIILIILLLCIRVSAVLNYNETFTFEVRWLFLKFVIYPQKEKPKKEEEKVEKNKPENKEKKVKTKKASNPLKTFYENQGFNGVLELIKNTYAALSGMMKRIMKSIIINDIDLRMIVSSGDAASTAIEYGKICSEVFPAMGAISSNVKVKKHNIDIRPDFINSIKKAQFHIDLSVTPLRITNAALILGIQLLFKVLIKFLIGSRKLNHKKFNNGKAA